MRDGASKVLVLVPTESVVNTQMVAMILIMLREKISQRKCTQNTIDLQLKTIAGAFSRILAFFSDQLHNL